MYRTNLAVDSAMLRLIAMPPGSPQAAVVALRTAIANHLASSRGIVADPSRIVIVSGVQEGLNIAARLFLSRGTLSVVEDPCYQGAALAFEAAGAEIVATRIRQRVEAAVLTTREKPVSSTVSCPSETKTSAAARNSMLWRLTADR